MPSVWWWIAYKTWALQFWYIMEQILPTLYMTHSDTIAVFSLKRLFEVNVPCCLCPGCYSWRGRCYSCMVYIGWGCICTAECGVSSIPATDEGDNGEEHLLWDAGIRGRLHLHPRHQAGSTGLSAGEESRWVSPSCSTRLETRACVSDTGCVCLWQPGLPILSYLCTGR